MKINNIVSQIKFINRIGATLSVDQRVNLHASTQKLSKQYIHQEFYLWGRIQGISSNYYIIRGTNYKGHSQPQHKYFWANQDFRFAQLPQVRLEFVQKVKKMKDLLTGQHEKILIKLSHQAPKIIKTPSGQQLIVKQKNFTQLDRLTIIIHLIEQQCSIVPVGAFIMLPTRQLIPNPDFRGLKIKDSKLQQNYVHLRKPKNAQNLLLIQSDKALQTPRFLDNLKTDPLVGTFSIQTDQSGTQITIRSLIWPGYLGYHRTNSNIFGGAYFGNGIQVNDIAFLI